MPRFLARSLSALFLVLLFTQTSLSSHGRQTPAPALRMEGAVEKSGDWTNAKIAKEFAAEIKSVDYTLKDVKYSVDCISLYSFLQAAHPRLRDKAKNPLLACVVLAQASDGYTVAFSLGELSPEYGKRSVWIALNRNGQPLPDNAAPVSLIVPDDAKPARWLHGVTRLLLIDGLALADQKHK